MKENNEKILKIIHIVAMSIWFSSLVTMGVITFSIDTITNSEAFKYAHEIVYVIDMYILTPAAIITLLTGIVYSVFTKWKVKDNLWLKIKAVITVALILMGTLYLAPLFKDMIKNVKISGVDVLTTDNYLKGLSKAIWFMIINGFLVLFVIIISVLKPGNKTKLA